jgi:hypothetical protein
MITTFLVNIEKGLLLNSLEKCPTPHPTPHELNQKFQLNTSQGQILEVFKVEFYQSSLICKGEGGGPPLFLFSKGGGHYYNVLFLPHFDKMF